MVGKERPIRNRIQDLVILCPPSPCNYYAHPYYILSDSLNIKAGFFVVRPSSIVFWPLSSVNHLSFHQIPQVKLAPAAYPWRQQGLQIRPALF